MYSYKPVGVCSREIMFDVEDGKVKNIKFVGGCMGNTTGVAKLAEGMKVEDVIFLITVLIFWKDFMK